MQNYTLETQLLKALVSCIYHLLGKF